MKHFTFYIENQAANKFTLSDADLVKRFTHWIKKKNTDELGATGSIKTVLNFLTGDDGLNATFDPSDFNDLFFILKKVYLKEVFKW